MKKNETEDHSSKTKWTKWPEGHPSKTTKTIHRPDYYDGDSDQHELGSLPMMMFFELLRPRQ